MDKARLRKRFIHHRNLLSRGHTEASLVFSLFQYSMIFWLFIRDLITIHRVWMLVIIPISAILATVIQYMIGYFWDKAKFVDEDNAWISERNPVLMNILSKAGDRVAPEKMVSPPSFPGKPLEVREGRTDDENMQGRGMWEKT